LDVVSDFSDTFLFISDGCIIFLTFDVNKIFIITSDLRIKYLATNRSLDDYKFNRFDCEVCHDKCVTTYERDFVCIGLDGEIGKIEDGFFIDDLPMRVDCDKIVYKRLHNGSEFTVLLNKNYNNIHS
jgi:hypothetical protein